jgi:hypothetical protein
MRPARRAAETSTIHSSAGLALVTAAIIAMWPSAGLRAQGDAYPVKPVRFVVGQAPGGATDIVGRMVAQKMTELLGQNVIIENRTGAAGSIAANLVAKSPPDGYTILLVSSSYSINPESLFEPAIRSTESPRSRHTARAGALPARRPSIIPRANRARCHFACEGEARNAQLWFRAATAARAILRARFSKISRV